MMYPNLDRFQVMKKGRMKFLLEEIEKKETIPLMEFLSYIAINYGIRRETGWEYIRDWIDGGCISVDNHIIKFIKKPEEWV
jgi:hypothetical protein